MAQVELKTISRFFTVPRIARPINLTTNFQYNYFVPDEAVNPEDAPLVDSNSFTYSYLQKDDDGNKYSTDPVTGNKLVYINGKLATGDALTRIHPRTVEIQWQLPSVYEAVTPGTLPTLESLYKDGMIVKEEDISSVYDANIRSVDTKIRDRIYRKARLLSNMSSMSEVIPAASRASSAVFNNQGAKSSGFTNISTVIEPSDTSKISNLFDLNKPENTKRVNEAGKTITAKQFLEAANHMPDFQYDRRLLEAATSSSLLEGTTHGRKMKKFVDDQRIIIRDLPAEQTKRPFVGDSEVDYASTITNIITETPRMKGEVISERFLNQKTVGGDQKVLQLAVVGYVVERYEEGQLGGSPSRMYFIDSGLNQNLVDANVIYGMKYYYSVRAVYVREDTVTAYDESGTSLGEETIRQYIASRPSLIEQVEIVETTPPNEPDGIFFKFNYQKKKGLMINWQYPVGRSRDTKYFQIFRRKTIHEPFQCIAELDFNNAIIKTIRREKVREERVIKLQGPTTFYEDSEFTRNSSYIYAIAAVDAHGLTSGYSYQTRLTFNRTTNKLEQKSISRSGAPKQYPNFYVDPDEDESVSVYSLTQDVITSSGKQRVKIYLDPDCEKYVLSTGEKRSLVNLTSGDSGGPVYKMHFINLDRHKDETLEIRIKDVRKE